MKMCQKRNCEKKIEIKIGKAREILGLKIIRARIAASP
jgi:hypothetical protein